MSVWRTALSLLLGQPVPEPARRVLERAARRRVRLAHARPATLGSLIVTALREVTLALLGQPSPSSARRRRPRR